MVNHVDPIKYISYLSKDIKSNLLTKKEEIITRVYLDFLDRKEKDDLLLVGEMGICELYWLMFKREDLRNSLVIKSQY